MFAIVKTGGKQYRVEKDSIITVEKLVGSPGDTIALTDVLVIGDDKKNATIGKPNIEKAKVFAEILKQTRGEKIIVFKKLRRKNYRRKKGHCQDYSVLKILGVSPTGAVIKKKETEQKKPLSNKAKKQGRPEKINASKGKATSRQLPPSGKTVAGAKTQKASPKSTTIDKKTATKNTKPAQKSSVKKLPKGKQPNKKSKNEE